MIYVSFVCLCLKTDDINILDDVDIVIKLLNVLRIFALLVYCVAVVAIYIAAAATTSLMVYNFVEQ